MLNVVCLSVSVKMSKVVLSRRVKEILAIIREGQMHLAI